MKLSGLTLLIRVTLGLALSFSSALATPADAFRSPLLRLLDEPLRALMRETPEWSAIEIRRAQLRQAADGRVVDLFDQEVMTRLRELNGSVEAQRRAARAEGRSASEIAVAESFWVDRLAGSRLRMLDELADLDRDISEFLGSSRMDFVGLARARVPLARSRTLRFLTEPSTLQGFNPAEYGTLLRQTGAAQREVHTWFERLEGCVRTASRDEMTRRQNFFFSTDIGIALGVTTMGFVSGAGEREVQWWTLPIDLLLTLGDRYLSSRFAFRDQPFRVRWVQGMLVGEGRAAIDFALFSIVPNSLDDHLGPHPERSHEAVARAEWASMWNVGMSLPTMAINTLLGGWECFSPAGSTRAAITVLRLGNSVVRSFASYRGRSAFYDHVLTER